ncbi:hypothetical protein SSTU70S_05579 [Stutzerimonas stutzeri]
MKKDHETADSPSTPPARKALTRDQLVALVEANLLTQETLAEALRQLQGQALTESLAPLTAGSLKDEHFDLLVQGTSIRAEGVIAAMRDHLVRGLTFTEAWTVHGVHKSQLSLRLKALQAEHARAARLVRFYR